MTEIQRLNRLIQLCIQHKITMYGYDTERNTVDIRDTPFKYPSEHDFQRLWLFLDDGRIEIDEWDESHHNGDIGCNSRRKRKASSMA